jgi:hypothetical protein
MTQTATDCGSGRTNRQMPDNAPEPTPAKSPTRASIESTLSGEREIVRLHEGHMPDQKVNALVNKWSDYGSDLDVFDLWWDACQDEPETAWLGILEVLKFELTRESESSLAAGPMEDLMVKHGATFIDRLELEAKRNPKFNHLLGGVWRQEMPLEIWSRIERARKEVW